MSKFNFSVEVQLNSKLILNFAYDIASGIQFYI